MGRARYASEAQSAMLLSGGSAAGKNSLPKQVEPRGGGARAWTRRMVTECWEFAVRRSESIDAVAEGGLCARCTLKRRRFVAGANGRDPEALLRA